jgi:N-acetylglucosamine-6-phosphate deacetylase
MDSLLTADAVVVRDRVVRPGWVLLRGDRVADVGEGPPPSPATHDLGPTVLVPGFVDVHCHGGGGSSFGTDIAAARRVIGTHRASGTTTMLASLVSAPVESMLRSVDVLGELVESGELAGVHLEGPWLSAAHCGAHDPAVLVTPERADVDLLVRPDVVRMVTIAPELAGAGDAVRRIVDAGAVAAVGHTAADAAQVREALRLGATHATHLFNAMPPLHHRTPGAVLALLDSDANLELIRDGHHLDPDLCRWLDATVTPGRLVAVSDAMAAAGSPDGDYLLGTTDVTVTDGVARVAETGNLAGSATTLERAFRAAAYGSTSDAALLRAVAQTAANPARALAISDVGAIEAGLRADIVVLDAVSLGVVRVLRRGAWVS